ncbi:MAG: membrane protein insertion efficiency factor YidD [Clostridiales bacterium]|nr:membrane protein insertion efficiency factor YidD [Candidatus Apopatousia equi]
MKKFVKIIFFPLKLILMGLIYLYKILISPLIPKSCIYKPSCSTYGLLAIKRFGIITGIFLTCKRILRCNHRHEGGLDPVPDNIEGELKWLI